VSHEHPFSPIPDQDFGPEDINRGEYLPQFFGIMCDETLASMEAEETFRHEFKHFLQMTSTTFGINHTHRLVERCQRFRISLRDVVIPYCHDNHLCL